MSNAKPADAAMTTLAKRHALYDGHAEYCAARRAMRYEGSLWAASVRDCLACWS